MNVYDINEVEKELRSLSDTALGSVGKYITDNFPNDITQEQLVKKISEVNREIIVLTHEGFKTAQNKLIEILLFLQDEQDKNDTGLKEATSNKDKKLTAELRHKSKYLEQIVVLFKHIADAILWHLIDQQLYISRRLYLRVGGIKKLKDVNLQSVKIVADGINANPENFVLISDITNNVQAGDLFGFVDKKFIIGEVKEGNKNIEILETIDELTEGVTTIKDITERFPKKMIEQLERTLKQHVTMSDITEIINKGKGMDPVLKQEITIADPKEVTPSYLDRLATLESQLNERNFWAYQVIEECLYIGLFKGEKRQAGNILLEGIAKQKNVENYFIIDVMNTLNSLNKPIFFLPFSPDFIFDILFGRIKMFFMLDIDKFISFLQEFGMKAEWATTKETHKMKEQAKGYDIFTLRNRGIKIDSESKDTTTWVGFGALLRIFFEHVPPSYVAYSMGI